jgi:hypothetical protein
MADDDIYDLQLSTWDLASKWASLGYERAVSSALASTRRT